MSASAMLVWHAPSKAAHCSWYLHEGGAVMCHSATSFAAIRRESLRIVL
jgi:hypothetical protein